MNGEVGRLFAILKEEMEASVGALEIIKSLGVHAAQPQLRQNGGK